MKRRDALRRTKTPRPSRGRRRSPGSRLPRRDHRRAEIEPHHRTAGALRAPRRHAGDTGRAVERSFSRPATMPTTPGCQAAPHTSSAAWPACDLVRPPPWRPPARRLDRPGAGGSPRPACRERPRLQSRPPSSRRRPMSASPMRPPALIRGPEHEAAGHRGRPVAAWHIQQRHQAGARAPRHHLQPLADQRAVKPAAASRRRPSPAPPGRADRADPARPRREKAAGVAARARSRLRSGRPRPRRTDPQAGGIVEPVRVDRRQHRRRRAFGFVVVQHDHVGSAAQRDQRLGGRGAAIDADDQASHRAAPAPATPARSGRSPRWCGPAHGMHATAQAAQKTGPSARCLHAPSTS